MPLRENVQLKFGPNTSETQESPEVAKDAKSEASENLKSFDAAPQEKTKAKPKKKKPQPDLALPSLRESCDTKDSLFDQTESKRLDSARELESRTAKLKQMKQELLQSMTARNYRREPHLEVTSELHKDISQVLAIDE
jgi:hypothetical protein